MASIEVAGAGSQPKASIVGTSKHTDADVILANVGGERPGDGRGGKQRDAIALIYRLLEEGGGEIEAKIAYAAGAAEGIPEATMRRARDAIGVTGGKVWTLDESGRLSF